MKKLTFVLLLSGLISSLVASVNVGAESGLRQSCKSSDPFCYEGQLLRRFQALQTVSFPKLATPAWLVAKTTPQPVARQVTYSVASRGVMTADFAEFQATAVSVYNNSSGWSRLGISFAEVAEGGDFTLWLAQDTEVPSFSPSVCDSTYSCSVGRNVIINQTRWLNGSDAWNSAGGSLSDYRAMVLNHELGHWLGHGHRFCSTAGASAPVMQQQSIDLQGCSTNAWPLGHELYAPKLGIRS